jgi:signal transduction histidine kinase
MELNRSQKLVTGLLAGAWLLVVGWQVREHVRVVEAARSDLRNRSHEIASTLGAVTRAMRFRGAIFQERLEPVLEELVTVHTNALVGPAGLLAVELLNTEGDPLFAVGQTNLFTREVLAEGEHWAGEYVAFVQPLAGDTLGPDSATNNTTVVLPSFRDLTNSAARDHGFPRHEPAAGGAAITNAAFPPADFIPPTNAAGQVEPPPLPPGEAHHPGEGDRSRNNHRAPWMRWMSEGEFKAFTAKRELHGLALVMSTDNSRTVCTNDWWLRCIIAFFAGISALGAGLAWRNMGQTAELQIRLVRASELNSHLKELNLAAAGLAHETRNPLNIIRGLAQMVSRLPDAPPEVREKTRTIVDETDKVTAQLTEFINYSRPREVRRTKISLTAAATEIIRTLNQDIAEKNLRVETTGEALDIEADEQLFRQVLFNLLLNAIQAAAPGGHIEIVTQRERDGTASVAVQDDGPGVPAERRQEIFKPYFTTTQRGTGLGLAVVQQIVLAHGWEIQCLPNTPHGAIFRLTHLKIAG